MEKRFLAAVMAAAMTVTLDAISTANTMQGTYVCRGCCDKVKL